MRPAGTLDHHTLFMIQTPPFMKGCEHFTFHLGGPTEVLQAGRASSRRATRRSGAPAGTCWARTGSGTSTARSVVTSSTTPTWISTTTTGSRAKRRSVRMPRRCSCSRASRNGCPPAAAARQGRRGGKWGTGDGRRTTTGPLEDIPDGVPAVSTRAKKAKTRFPCTAWPRVLRISRSLSSRRLETPLATSRLPESRRGPDRLLRPRRRVRRRKRAMPARAPVLDSRSNR